MRNVLQFASACHFSHGQTGVLGIKEEDQRGEVSFLSHPSMLSTRPVTADVGHLAQAGTHLHCTHEKEVTVYRPHFGVRELQPTSLSGEFYINYLGSSCTGGLPVLPLFSYLVLYLHLYRLMNNLLCTLGYNPILYYLCCCSNCPSFVYWELLQLAPVSL